MRLDWKGVLGLTISAALLTWTLRHESPAAIWAVLRASNLWLMVGGALIATLVFPLRALRWQVILEPIARLPFGPLWRSVAVGMMVNNVVPARAGELARAYAITRETPQVGFAAAFASLAVDRLMDAVVVVCLLVASVSLSGISPDTTISGVTTVRSLTIVSGLIAVGALAFVTLMAFAPALVERMADRVLAAVAPRFRVRLLALLRGLLSGLGALRSPSRFARILAWATVMWLVNALSFWISFRSVGIDVPYSAALFVQGIIAIGVAFPSSPGFFGVFEFAGVNGLALYNVPASLAVSWALGFHILSFLPITFIGLYYFGRMGLHFRDIGKAKASAT